MGQFTSIERREIAPELQLLRTQYNTCLKVLPIYSTSVFLYHLTLTYSNMQDRQHYFMIAFTCFLVFLALSPQVRPSFHFTLSSFVKYLCNSQSEHATSNNTGLGPCEELANVERIEKGVSCEISLKSQELP